MPAITRNVQNPVIPVTGNTLDLRQPAWVRAVAAIKCDCDAGPFAIPVDGRRAASITDAFARAHSAPFVQAREKARASLAQDEVTVEAVLKVVGKAVAT